MNRVWAARRAAVFTRARFGGRATRLCVRTLAFSRGTISMSFETTRGGTPARGPTLRSTCEELG